ncbi:MAG: imidazole glycerol phosphate synthase subunit HisH [Thermicanus sp.]|nr:imidazole glycerol phosphate synthase subunit HisH [Thermicanus sp.]
MIGILDYGMGNLYSVGKALERLGYPCEIISKPEEVERVDRLILPGVGAFGDAMAELKGRNLVKAIRRHAEEEKPLLGICLGMQLLFDESEEHGWHEGLHLLPGRVVRFQGGYKIPHMGWNRLRGLTDSPLFHKEEEGYVYFVHSYYVVPERRETLLAVTDYHQEVPAIVGERNLFGVQFHPEKSGEVGMKILGRFLSYPPQEYVPSKESSSKISQRGDE